MKPRYFNNTPSLRSAMLLLLSATCISLSATAVSDTLVTVKNAHEVTVKAAGDGLKYTWYVKNAGKKTFTKVSTKTASYSCKMTATAKNRQVYCVVTDKYGKTVKTVTVTLKMK